ncbi:hypothetical protein [Paraliobacillus ryukyuensis]|uniref:hypothetical protein n=1 Tax=Paraliobacillus ryukyuensis TaxID=200904 RepID=UPI0015C488C2|nr:hypothetical protein [Paraliobacillus ryukyuensis]
MRKKIIGLFLALVILTSTSVVSAADQTSHDSNGETSPQIGIFMNDPGHGDAT